MLRGRHGQWKDWFFVFLFPKRFTSKWFQIYRKVASIVQGSPNMLYLDFPKVYILSHSFDHSLSIYILSFLFLTFLRGSCRHNVPLPLDPSMCISPQNKDSLLEWSKSSNLHWYNAIRNPQTLFSFANWWINILYSKRKKFFLALDPFQAHVLNVIVKSL